MDAVIQLHRVLLLQQYCSRSQLPTKQHRFMGCAIALVKSQYATRLAAPCKDSSDLKHITMSTGGQRCNHTIAVDHTAETGLGCSGGASWLPKLHINAGAIQLLHLPLLPAVAFLLLAVPPCTLKAASWLTPVAYPTPATSLFRPGAATWP